jgi:transposase InsO family protein
MDQRIEFCCRALCREYGISAKTGYKWQERFLREAASVMKDQSRRPRSHPESLGEEELCRMVGLKVAHPQWGPRKLRELYHRRYGRAASESSFKRVLERSGLTQKRRRRLAHQSGGLCSGRVAQGPHQIWTVDFKGWWYTGLERCEPLTVRDEYSRYLLELRSVENARTETVQGYFERLFERSGLPDAIRSDNGSPFASRSAVQGLSRLSAWRVALGIDLERGRPGHPQDNGAHERLHRDISLELQALGRIDQHSLELWRQEFNEQRPHEALGMRTPSEVYQPSTRSYGGGVQQLDYPQMIARRVNQNGKINWANHQLFVSSSLAGWSVGLQPLEDHQLEVWFARLLLGWIDPQTVSFQRADLPPHSAT